MTSLDDLVRDTLAARAHDVDGLVLTTTPPPRRPGRRWVAAGTVVAVAAAIVVAVVLVAPWRGTPDHHAGPAAAPTPPAGMQWVSYHGITFTIPDGFRVTDDPCPVAPGSPGLVSVGGNDTSCSRMPIATDDGPFTFVTLGVLGDQPPAGVAVSVASHPARRADVEYQSSPPFVGVTLQLIDVDVSLGLAGRSEEELQSIIDTIEYTPVDHLGCAASLSHIEPTGPGPVSGALTGVVCDYTAVKFGLVLIGSRPLTAAELATVTGPASPASGSSSGLGADRGVLVYRLTLADGSARDLAVPVDESETRLPRAYPR